MDVSLHEPLGINTTDDSNPLYCSCGWESADHSGESWWVHVRRDPDTLAAIAEALQQTPMVGAAIRRLGKPNSVAWERDAAAILDALLGAE